MAIPDTQRIAIETLVERAGHDPIDLRKIARNGITLNGRPISYCGVSIGRGPQSRSDIKVAVFYYGTIRTSRVTHYPSGLPIVADAAVLLRPPTQDERAAWGPNTALQALDAIRIEELDGDLHVTRSGHSITYVPL